MDLISGAPYWVVKNGLLQSYPRLTEDLSCDVLVVGAGITGALIADSLAQSGRSVCVIDRREAGWGSTAASTALLQYEIDTELQDLAERYGLPSAVLAYRTCEQAVGALGRLARSFRGAQRVDYRPMSSLYFASRWFHLRRLEKEAALRQAQGFSLQVLHRKALSRRFGIDSPVGLLTPVAAEVDPYQLAHRLLKRLLGKGGRVHARTALQSFRPVARRVRAETDQGLIIDCGTLIFAAGYESQTWLNQRVARNRSSYAWVSEPLPGQLGPLKSTLMWESARPYLYLRRTADQRLIVGGEDDNIDIPLRRDVRVASKAQRLLKRVENLLPGLKPEIAFAWAGTFAETEDGLPFFGPHPQYGPKVLFAMAFGGNGITYSLIGADLIRAGLEGEAHPCAKLFGFGRLAGQ